MRNIISSLGFNSENLIQKKIPNNIFDVNQKAFFKFNFYNSFQKFSLLTNYVVLNTT